ncbi:MAG: hypothetical protein LBP59_20250 [Planctomycetaceae bacterium]|nr:hypothetical protein [Planctomycetaceae bacterium]
MQKNEFLEIPFYCYKNSSAGSRASRLFFRIVGILSGFLQVRRRNACIPGSRASRLHAVVLNR